jgi:hypothetical protein
VHQLTEHKLSMHAARVWTPYLLLHRLALEVQSWYRQQLETEPVRFMETQGVAGEHKAWACAR